MFEIYKKLFNDLNKKNIEYIVYKGLIHLEDDLNGQRGDIDILINNIQKFEKVLENHQWIKILKDNYPKYYFKLFNKLNLMLDIESKIQLGEKPFRPYYFNVDINKLKTTKFKDITILANEDYIPLMFVIRVTAKSDKKENLEELQNLLQKTKVNGYMKEIVETLTKIKWEEIEKDILKAILWQELKNKYKDLILKNANIDKKALLSQKFKWIIGKYKAIQKRILKNPPYRVRKKGYLVAFMGNDGAGKSSTIEAILNIDYFKYTGIKMIYFGNNQYIIPCLTNMIIKFSGKNKILTIVLSILAKFDRYYIRVLKAKYFIYKGYIVLADRYIYDDMMGIYYNRRKNTNNVLKKIYRYILKPRILIEPEIMFFLNVDPEVAYTRKQDYDFEIVKENIKKYREFLFKFDNVIKIDANQSKDKVINEVIKRLYEKDIEINQKYQK